MWQMWRKSCAWSSGQVMSMEPATASSRTASVCEPRVSHSVCDSHLSLGTFVHPRSFLLFYYSNHSSPPVVLSISVSTTDARTPRSKFGHFWPLPIRHCKSAIPSSVSASTGWPLPCPTPICCTPRSCRSRTFRTTSSRPTLFPHYTIV